MGTFVINYFPEKNQFATTAATKDLKWGGDIFHRLFSG